MKYSLHTYKKGLKVIDSCTNTLQLEGARNYCNNFFKFHSDKLLKTKTGFTTYLTDDLIGKMYSRLLKKLYLKERSLSE